MALVKRDFVNRASGDGFVADDEKHPLTFVRAAYDFDTRLYDDGLDCQEFLTDDGEVVPTPSLTRQADADDCDINVMMAKYQATGEPPRANPRSPQYGDFTAVPQYQEALNTVMRAQEDFDALDAKTRERFGNTPAGMLAFLSDPANREEAIKMGLVAAPEPPPAPMKVEVVNPPPSKAEGSLAPRAGA